MGNPDPGNPDFNPDPDPHSGQPGEGISARNHSQMGSIPGGVLHHFDRKKDLQHSQYVYPIIAPLPCSSA